MRWSHGHPLYCGLRKKGWRSRGEKKVSARGWKQRQCWGQEQRMTLWSSNWFTNWFMGRKKMEEAPRESWQGWPGISRKGSLPSSLLNSPSKHYKLWNVECKQGVFCIIMSVYYPFQQVKKIGWTSVNLQYAIKAYAAHALFHHKHSKEI